MKTSIRTFAADESAATAIEYALLCSLIACFLIFGLNALGTRMNSVYAEITSALN